MNNGMRKLTAGLAVLAVVSPNITSVAFASSNEDIKNNIYEHLKNMETSFSVSYGDKDILDIVKNAAEKDDYLDMSIIKMKAEIKGNNSNVNITYRTTDAQEKYINNELTKVINSIITPNMSDVDKVKAINQYLVDRFEYDYSLQSNNAYLALTEGKGTCQGYIMTAYKMFNLAGIENRIVTGTLDGVAHGWNSVNINGQWYNIDITNNDSTKDINKFLLKSDDYLSKEGFVWDSKEYPKCSSDYDFSSEQSANISGWYKKDDSWYFKNSSGKDVTGWNHINEKWYYLGTDGKMETGWFKDNGNWYYCLSNGEMATNIVVDGYYLNNSGIWEK